MEKVRQKRVHYVRRGEFLERLATNYFYSDYFLGEDISNNEFVHYPNEKWFQINEQDKIPHGILDKYLLETYNPEGDLRPEHLIDTNSGNKQRGILHSPLPKSFR